LFTEAQLKYGNVSGATVPLGLSMLNEQNRLKAGTKILSAMAGVGGNYGAFTYIVPETSITIPIKDVRELDGKTAMVLGAESELGKAIVERLLEYGAEVIAVETSGINSVRTTNSKTSYLSCSFSEIDEVNSLVKHISDSKLKIHYLIQAASSLVQSENINFFAPLQIIKAFAEQKPNCILAIGSICESVGFPGNDSYVSSLTALHGALASASGEFSSYGIRVIYYMTGFTENDPTIQMDEKTRFRLMTHAGQENPLKIGELAERIVRSLFILKVESTWSSYENAMVLRCDGFKPKVDI